MAASPLAIAAVSAVAAVVLHRGRTKSLREQYTAAKELLSQLTLELEAVQEELQSVHENMRVQNDNFQAAWDETEALSGRYHNMVLQYGELQGRLGRSESFNQELQQTIKRERAERAQREQRITELESKIQEQKVTIAKLQHENCGEFTARTDENSKMSENTSFSTSISSITPPLPEGERRIITSGSWSTRLPRPPVPFRELSFRNTPGQEQ